MQSEQFLKRLNEISDIDFLYSPEANTRIGVKMGDVFKLAKEYIDMPLREVKKLLIHDVHEARVGAVSILDFNARNKKISDEYRKELYEFYLDNHQYINTWDLVDRAAPYVIGGYLNDKSRQPLYDLAKSSSPMERRTAITATYYFIREGDIDDTFALAAILAGDKEKFVQTAVGSWLREAGKQNSARLVDFLVVHKNELSKIAMRYAMEKLDQGEKELVKKIS